MRFGCEMIDLNLAWLQRWYFRENLRLIAFAHLLTLHRALRFRTQIWSLALPMAHRLSAHVPTRLLILATVHYAFRFATSGLAGGAILCRAKVLWANHFTVWLSTLHLATMSVEALATRGAHWLVTHWPTMLRAPGRVALPMAQWRTFWLSTSLFLFSAPRSPSTIALEVVATAFRISHDAF